MSERLGPKDAGGPGPSSRGLSLDPYVPLRWRVMAPTEKRPPHRGGHDGADKPEHNLVHHCFASERRRHWASLKRWARFDVGRQPPTWSFARAGDLGPNEDAHSPELGRSPFWGRPSRALPDPETLAPASERLGPRIVPAVKSPQRPANAISEDAFVVRHPRRPNVALPTVGRPSSNR